MIYDRLGRPILSVRVSITRRCNLDCIYCHEEGMPENSAEEMTPGEISRIIGICAKHGVKKVKITGGEPLLRSDITEIVGGISGLGIEDISMTTNATYLKDYAEGLKESGLKRINVSLDTLKPEVFKKITKGGNLDKVTEGIEAAIKAGLYPVKLNMVIMKGINDGEILELLDHYSRDGVVLQLIELVDAGSDEARRFFDRHYYSLDGIEKEFERNAIDVRVRKFMQDRRKYTLNGSQVEVIRPMHNTDFCAHCTRIRITANGKFKPCLMRTDNFTDFLTPMREGANDKKLEVLFKDAVNRREPFFKRT
ncbi:MAG: GTP 3',8-cyclase MoaA [Candidatus Hydrothermarchaeaceae archaeon]